VQQLSEVGDTSRQVELVRQLWRVDSSSTEPVLTALAGAAPAPGQQGRPQGAALAAVRAPLSRTSCPYGAGQRAPAR
jgi:hypothetical protein